jgi:hypothetical protein
MSLNNPKIQIPAEERLAKRQWERLMRKMVRNVHDADEEDCSHTEALQQNHSNQNYRKAGDEVEEP